MGEHEAVNIHAGTLCASADNVVSEPESPLRFLGEAEFLTGHL